MTHEGARGPEVDPFSLACRDAVFLGARFGYEGNLDRVSSFFEAHGADARSEDLFAFYNWVADQADRAREGADTMVPDSLREAVYGAVLDSPQKSKYDSFPQGQRPASFLLAGLSFDSGIYHGIRSVPSGAEVISASRTPYSVSQARHFRTSFSVRAGRVPVLSRRTIFAGSSRARV